MEYWRLVKNSGRQQSLMVRLMRDVESGHFHVPIGFDALKRYTDDYLAITRLRRVHMVTERLCCVC